MIIVQREGLILGECGQVHTLGPGRSQGRDSRILQGGMNHGVVLEQTTQAEAHNHQQKVIEVAAHSLLKPARQGSIAISASQIIGFFFVCVMNILGLLVCWIPLYLLTSFFPFNNFM